MYILDFSYKDFTEKYSDTEEKYSLILMLKIDIGKWRVVDETHLRFTLGRGTRNWRLYAKRTRVGQFDIRVI
jgi:hypothetical protein